MKQHQSTLCFLVILLFHFDLSAQRIKEFITSDSAIRHGIRLHNSDKYQEAISYYKKVSPNDPRYPLAVYEIALSFFELKTYDSTIYYTGLCIDTKDQEMYEDAYVLRGKAYNKKEDYASSIKNFEGALAIYPKNVTLLHHKGVALKGDKQYQKALDIFKDVNVTYAGFIKNQIALAEMAENEGLITQSFLAYTHAMLYAIGTNYSIGILDDMNKLAAKKLEENPNNIVMSEKGDQFSEIETLLKSKVALSGKYKIETNIDYPVVRQLHLIMSQLDKYEPTDGYFDTYYVPFYKELYKEGYFPRLIDLLFLKINDPKVQTSIRKNEKEILEFIDWSRVKLASTVNKREIEANGKKMTMPCMFSRGEKSCGEFEDKKGTGVWYYFHDNGNLKCFGELKEGKSEGKWEYFYENGKKRSEINYVADKKDGNYIYYFQNGNKKETGAYKEDSLEGEKVIYYENGNTKSQGSFINNKYDGIWKSFYRNGKPKATYNYKDDLLDGEYTTYASDGNSVTTKLNYKEGKLDGFQESFFITGSKKEEGTYKNNNRAGDYKEYFIDGTLQEDTKINEEDLVESKEYYVNGKLSALYAYDKGELESKDVYNYDGDLHCRYNFKNDYLKQAIYFDKSGKEINKESVGKNDEFSGKWFYTNNKSMQGNYKKGKRTGKWTYYNINGTKDEENSYEKGVKTGIQKSFDGQGRLVKEFEMLNGKYNGFYREYFNFGGIKLEGWYEDDDKVGNWYKYYSDGTLKEELYYVNGDIEGKNTEYDPDGKIFAIYYFKNGEFKSYENYDKEGTLLNKTEIANAVTTMLPSSKLKFASYKSERVNGLDEGAYYSEPIAGYFDYRGNYTSGNEDGLLTYYFKNGVKKQSINYKLGSAHGNDTFFYINGAVFSVSTYILGNEYGTYTRYYYNGNKWIERKYINGNRDSLDNYYGMNGELVLQKHYRLGYLEYIVKNNDDGEFKDTVRLKNESLDYTAKYQNGAIAIKETLKFEDILLFQVFDEKETMIYNFECDEAGFMKKKEYFYTNGKLMSQEVYNKGLDNGEFLHKRENGTLIVSEEYKEDKLHGNVKVYDESGNLLHHLIYRNGVAYKRVQ